MSATKTPTPAQPLADPLARLHEINSKLDRAAEGNASLRKGAPFVRTGEDPLTSRGFMFSRVIGVMTGKMDPAMAKVERDLTARIQNEYVARGLYSKEVNGSVVVPLSSELMFEADPSMEKLSREVGDIVAAGVAGADVGEMVRARQKFYGARNKTLSWMDAGNLAELVPPPVFGEPIELLRNKEVFLAAGARLIPFPPSGRAVWPRFTGATTAYWVGSGINDRPATPSEPTTGDLVLQVKKLGVLVTIPNELFRFPTVSVEQIIRADMALSASLKMDAAFIHGTGSAHEPKGIINYDNVLSYTAGSPGTDGDSLDPEDVLQIIAEVEEQNVDFGAWVGRAKLYAGLGNRRADATTPGDRRGPFLFNMLRDSNMSSNDATQPSVGRLEGYPFYKSNQVPKNRAKGAGTALTLLLGGQFNHYMVAMSGVMEFAVATQGDTIFPADQTQIRLFTWCDGAPRYEEAFCVVDTLNQTS